MSLEEQLRRSRKQNAARMQASAPATGREREDRPLAKAERKGEFLGTGCVVQGIGLAVLLGGGIFFGIFAIPVGLVVLIAGGRMALKWRCSACKNPIAGKAVRLCPACGARLL